jgi:uncharacterized protein (TIGR02145 family)
MKACPKGWYLPSNTEWDKLYRYADGDKGTESPYESETAGKYLKATSGWNDYRARYNDNTWSLSGNGQDTHNFSALPGGYCDSNGSFLNVGYFGYWWSNSENDSGYVYRRRMAHFSECAYSFYSYKRGLYSVRCIGD